MAAEEKANYFAYTFATKNIMIKDEDNKYSEIAYDHSTFYCGFQTIEATEKALSMLDSHNALCPDIVPTKLLKRCSHVLAPILHKLIIAILIIGE